MKKSYNRLLSAMLALMMVLSIVLVKLPVDVFAASVNTGVRHEVCTELSSQAKSYYTGSDTYAVISGLQGGTSDCLDQNNLMFQALSDLMSETHTKTVSYSSLVDHWVTTDANKGSSNAVLFYSDQVSGSYNREHVWPKSHASFHEKNGGADA